MRLTGNPSQIVSRETVFETFVDKFFEIVTAENLDIAHGEPLSREAVKRFLNRMNSTHVDMEKFAASLDVGKILEYLEGLFAEKSLKDLTVCFAPCSVLVDEFNLSFMGQFDNVVLVDANRKGRKLGGKVIQGPDQIRIEEIDICLILTRNQDAIELYENFFENQVVVNLNDEKFCKVVEDKQFGSGVQYYHDFIGRMGDSDFPVLIATAQPRATLQTTTTQLTRDNVDVYWALSQDVGAKDITSYGTPRSSDLDVKEYIVMKWKWLMFTFCNQPKGIAIYHYEDAYAPAWDFRRVAISYAFALATCRTVKALRPQASDSRLIYLMYDAIKPGVKNFQYGAPASSLYKQLMGEAEGILFSSYTEGFGDFVENAVGKKLPRAHFHRYQVNASDKRPRRKDGYHVAIISVALEEFFEPSRTGLRPYIRAAMESGIHIHYYAGKKHHAYIEKFRDSLSTQAKDRFHLHHPIHDLQELAEELSEYHAGWCLLNMQIFNSMVAELKDQFMRDAMDLFTPTTLPSVMWSCAAAGLPVICNRSMYGVSEVLPKELVIPMQLSEAGNLYDILDNMDWDKVDSVSGDHLDMKNRIHEFYDFVEDLTGKRIA